MRTTYELRKFKSSSDKNLTQALSIYTQNIDPLIRTDTREILHWIDYYNSRFPDRFYIVGLYVNELLAGYAQFVYFREEKIVFIDYVAIEKKSRGNNTFYVFIEKISEFFIDERIEFNYLVTEVGYYKENKTPTEISRNLIRLLKMSGFGVVKMSYYQPMLGKHNYETELNTILMLYNANDLKQIKRETFLLLVDTIYFKHYKRWYDAFLNDKDQAGYVQRLNELKSKIENNIKKKDFIEINGYTALFATSQVPTPQKTYMKIAKILAAIIIFLVLAGIVGAAVLFVKKRFDIDQETLRYITFVSLIIIVLLALAFYKNKNESFSDVVEKVIKLFVK